MIFKIIFLIIICLINNSSHLNSTSQANECTYLINKYFETFDTWYYTLVHNFKEFNELYFNCNKTFKIQQALEFVPSTDQIIIDQKFNLNLILANIKPINYLYMIYMKGIDMNSNKIVNKSTGLALMFIFSKFNVYNNGKKLNITDCNFNYFKNMTSFFSNFYHILISNTKYDEQTCPLIFYNVKIYKLYIYDIANSFLNKNRLRFIKLNNSTGSNLNASKVTKLNLDIKYETLISEILNEYIFESLIELRLEGVLYGIQSDLFLTFKYLKFVDMRLGNYRQFFQNGINWLASLNSEFKVNLTDTEEFIENSNNYILIRFQYSKIFTLIQNIYDYPNEDFCLFYKFPHEQLVIPVLLPGKKVVCSCTVLWLIQYFSLYFGKESDLNYIDNYDYGDLEFFELKNPLSYCLGDDYKRNLNKCDFKTKISYCDRIKFKIYNENSQIGLQLNNDIDILYLVKWIQFVLNVLLLPIFSTLGIITNLLTILVIKNKANRKLFMNNMYKYILINSIFNVFYCLLMEFKILNDCLFYTSSVFCSPVYQTKSAQYFKIIVIYFMGNVLTYCKNVSFLFFTLSRYILILSKKNGLFKKIENMNLKTFLMIIFAISLTLSIFKLFQYQIADNYDSTMDFPNEIYKDTQCNLEYTFYCSLFSAFKLVNDFINNILIFILNFLVDVFLVKNYNLHLKNKRKSFGLSVDDDEKTRKKRINRMILISSILHLIFYFPGFILTLLLIIYSKQIYMKLQYSFSSDVIIEEAQGLSLISIACQFHILLWFNKNFNKSFHDIFNNFRISVNQKNDSQQTNQLSLNKIN